MLALSWDGVRPCRGESHARPSLGLLLVKGFLIAKNISARPTGKYTAVVLFLTSFQVSFYHFSVSLLCFHSCTLSATAGE